MARKGNTREDAPSGASVARKRKETPKVGPDWQGPGFQFIYYFPQILSGIDMEERHTEDGYHMQELLDACKEIGKCFEQYINHEVSTLDEAFKVARPKGYHQAAERKRYLKRSSIRRDAHRLIRAGATVDKQLFEFLGSLHGMGATLASEYYYSWNTSPPTRGTASPDDLPVKLRAYFEGSA